MDIFDIYLPYHSPQITAQREKHRGRPVRHFPGLRLLVCGIIRCRASGVRHSVGQLQAFVGMRHIHAVLCNDRPIHPIKYATDTAFPNRESTHRCAVLGLGFFYRVYEPLTEKYFRPFYLLIGILIYASLMYMENHILKERTSNLFWNNGVNNFPLYFLYAFTGIATLLLIVKQAKTKIST